jgi:hypothetical protein
MSSPTRPAAAALVVVLFALAGCTDGAKTGEVTGTVMVDNQIPADGSSITFIPADGKSPSAGAAIVNGKYAAKVPVGPTKVEIRVPKPANQPKGKPAEGPGPGGDIIEESLPAKYNDRTELTFDVKAGPNEKNWELSTKGQ